MILVTGGTGHLGSHLLYELVKKNKPVRAIYRNKESLKKTREIFCYYQHNDNIFNTIEWVEADINDYYSLCQCLKDVSLVFHAAGYVTFNDKEKEKLNHINVEGTANIVNACLESGVSKLGYVSSIAGLGEAFDNEPVTETGVWNQNNSSSAYGKSKYLAEMEVWRGINEGLRAFIVNPSVITGPGMWLGPSSNLWKSVQKGLKYYPKGSTGYIDVRDVASVMVKLSEMDISGERYILNAGHMSHLNIMTLLARGLNARGPGILINSSLANAALIFESIRSFVTRSDKRFNRRTIQIANKNLLYSGDKIKALLGTDFITVEESIRSAIQVFNNLGKSEFL